MKPKLRLSPEPKASRDKPAEAGKAVNFVLKFFREFLKISAVLAVAGLLFYYYVLPSLLPAKKLTGNQVMLTMCNWELTAWKSYQPNEPAFNFHRLPNDQRRRVLIYGLNQDFAIRTNFVWGSTPTRKIVIVSGRLFDNVPTPMPWNLFRRNPAHAVGYSDGTTGLISPEEFAALNPDEFTSMWSLATNVTSSFKIFTK